MLQRLRHFLVMQPTPIQYSIPTLIQYPTYYNSMPSTQTPPKVTPENWARSKDWTLWAQPNITSSFKNDFRFPPRNLFYPNSKSCLKNNLHCLPEKLIIKQLQEHKANVYLYKDNVAKSAVLKFANPDLERYYWG